MSDGPRPTDANARRDLWRRLEEAHGGAIPFEAFMRAALYDPSLGYYTCSVGDLGRAGDFSTSATLSEAFGEAIARWARRNRIRRRGRWHLVELGGGTGALGRAVLRTLGPLGRLGLTYHVVEISEALRDRQRAALGAFEAVWHLSPGEALDACGGEAVLFSNELVDAFPCRVFDKRADGWMEVCVRLEEGRPAEVLRRGPLPESAVLVAWAGAPDGQRVEVHESYRAWLEDWVPRWKRGSMLTIDYGDVAEALYFRRPRGSVRGYSHHQRLEGLDVYARIGLQDLTADVCFDDLVRWGEAAGLAADPLLTQRELLLGEVPGLAERAVSEPALSFLLDPRGAGSAFKALVQRRGGQGS